MRAFFKRINIFFLFVFLFLSCGKKENIYLLPSKYKLPSQVLIQELKVEIKNNNEIEILYAKLWFKKNKARIEIKKTGSDLKQTIIADEKKLYLIDENSKTGYMCSRNSDYALQFLSEIILNTGIGNTKEKLAGSEKVGGRDFLIYQYNMYVREQGFFTPALIKEYRDKLNDKIVKIVSEIKPFYSDKKFIKTLEIIKTKNKFYLSDKLFKIKEDIKIIELKNYKK